MDDDNAPLSLALKSLDGLSVGDAFGELFFRRSPYEIEFEELPSRWMWTDDTHMALSIVEILESERHIDQDKLARAFARRYKRDPHRGYAGGAHKLLKRVANGEDWRTISPALFGTGSYGNGAAMRVAPVGGYFHTDLKRAAEEAQLSAVITHSHPEGKAGAIAVAVAAAVAANRPHPTGNDFLHEILLFIPDGITKERIQLAMQISPDAMTEAMIKLGTGSEVSAQDTVPFCLWSAAHHLGNYEEALWWTAKGAGDCDTTCAIVGGIVALSVPEVPRAWLDRREPIENV